MIQLSQYLTENVSLIFESTFNSTDFYKHSYAADCIQKICSGQSVRIGVNGDQSFTADQDDLNDLKVEFDKLGSDITVDQFNQIMKSYNLPSWSKIFKGDFSGYTNGLASKNRGNAFEDDYIVNFEKYREDLEKCLHLKKGELKGITPVALGSLNQKRPLVNGPNGIILSDCGKDSIGDLVVDILVPFPDSPQDQTKGYNLSLKFGKTVTFCNAGISKLFPKKSFDDYQKTGKYEPVSADISGQDILDMFGIDNEKFAEVFVSHGSGGHGKDHVDVTTDIQKNKGFIDFVESVVGYGYVLVHKIGNIVHNISIMTPQERDKLIGRVKSAVVQYGGVSGSGKRIDIVVEFAKMTIKFNIRSKSGSLFPTHIMADYEIHY